MSQITIEKFEAKLIEILNRVRISNDCLSIYRTICNQDIKTLNISPAFFAVTKQALLYNSVMEIYKIFDSSKNSVQHAISISKSNPNLFISEKIETYYNDAEESEEIHIKINLNEELLNLESDIQNYQSAIDNLKIHRDKYYAHNDNNSFLEVDRLHFFENIKVTFAEIENLIDCAGTVTNKLLLLLNKETSSYGWCSINIDDLNNLIKRIK